MNFTLIAENTGFELILWNGLTIVLWMNDEFFCEIDYIGHPDIANLKNFQVILEEGTQRLETISEVLGLIRAAIKEDDKVEMEIVS